MFLETIVYLALTQIHTTVGWGAHSVRELRVHVLYHTCTMLLIVYRVEQDVGLALRELISTLRETNVLTGCFRVNAKLSLTILVKFCLK